MTQERLGPTPPEVIEQGKRQELTPPQKWKPLDPSNGVRVNTNKVIKKET